MFVFFFQLVIFLSFFFLSFTNFLSFFFFFFFFFFVTIGVVSDLSAGVLKECSSEIAPVLAYIFNESLAQGAVPDDWRLANVTPVFKRGKNTMLLITDRCRSRASAAKPWSIY